MANIASLSGTLTLDNSQFEARLNASRRTLDSSAVAMQRGLKSVDGGFSRLSASTATAAGSIAGLARSFVPVLGAAGLAAMAKQAIETVGGLGELSDQIGVTSDTLQTFRYAASQVGVSNEEMDASLAKLTKTIGLAATGNKEAIESFNRFGIKVLDAEGKVRPTDAVIRDMADALQKLPDPAQRAALATDLMGRAGQKLVPFLQDGSRGIDDLTRKAREMGLVFDRETIARADEAADKLSTLSQVLGVQFNAVLVEIAPALTAVANGILGFSENVRHLVETFKSLNDLGTDSLLGKLDALQKKRDELIAAAATPGPDATVDFGANSLWEWLTGTRTEEPLRVGESDKQLADVNAEIAQIQAIIRRRRDAMDNLRSTGGGATNPPIVPTGKSDAEREVEAAQRKLDSLKGQIAEIGKTGADLELTKALEGLNLQNPGVAALVDKFKEAAKAIQADKDATEALDTAWKGAQDSMDAWNKEQERGKQITESLRTPSQQYAATMSELNKLLAAGAISHETWAKGAEQAKDAMENVDSEGSKLGSTLTELGATWSSTFEDAAIAMQDAGFSVESLGDALKGLGEDIERVLLRIGVTDPIAQGLTGALKGIDWSSIFGPGKYGISSGKMQSSGGGGGFFSGIWDFITSIFHTGGVVGSGSASSRRVPSSVFAGAPRLHSGGFIGAGEVPAILKRGEGVFTQAQMAALGPAGGNGPYKIQIVNNTGVAAEGKAETRTGPDGTEQLVVTLEKRLADSVRRGGPLGRAISDRLGAPNVPQVRRS